MQRIIARLLIFGLSALCAGALADISPDSSFSGSSSTSPIPAILPRDSWRSLLRRNVGQMVKREEGIRIEKNVKNLDLENWSTETVKLCAAKLESAKPASNPAGVAGCWNLPILVTSTGVFAADLRLFRVSEPTGDWKNVDVSAYNISIEYDNSAAIQPRNLTEKEKNASEEGMKDSNLVRLIDYQFIGNLDQSLLTADLSDTELKVLVTPHISIQALTNDGRKEVNTTVSIAESKFINGVFADTPNLSDKEGEEVKSPPFQLPGTKIAIVPAGLYFFSAYLLVACSVFGWGTLERARFRDQYRKRIATQGYR